MEFADLRRGSDVEFGQSIYEPFGIAQIEPLGFGAISVVSDVCGCVGFVNHSTGNENIHLFIRGDYTRLDRPLDLEGARALGLEARRRAEAKQARQTAARLAESLPRTREQAGSLLAQGFRLASAMSWENVVQDYFLPVLERIEKAR